MAGMAGRLPAREEMGSRRATSFARLDLASIRAWPIARQVLLCIVVLYLAKQAINVFIFPPFTGHDEVAHFAYIRTVATEYRVPVIPDLAEFQASVRDDTERPGDFLPLDLYPYCQYALDWGFCNEPQWRDAPPEQVTYNGRDYYPWGWQYAANHPPLYYLSMAPLYRLTAGASPSTQQYLFRFAAIPFGLATVLLAYAIVRLTFPTDRFLAVTVPAFVALQPQVSYEAAMVNNDIAGVAIYSALLYCLVRGVRRGFSWRLVVGMGLGLGIGLLVKSTTITIIPVIVVAVVLGCGIAAWRTWVTKGAAIALIAGAVSWPWYLYLFRTYGNLSALDQVAELQIRWTYPGGDAPTIWEQLSDRDFAALRWREAWGEFGWRLIHLSDQLLWLIGIPSLVATAGLLGYLVAIAIKWRPGDEPGRSGVAALESSQVVVILTMALTAIVAYAAVLQFGTRFSLTQSRYLFPAVIAFAFLLMLGLRAVTPTRGLRFVQAGVVGGLVLLNVAIYTQYVIPYWYLAT